MRLETTTTTIGGGALLAGGVAALVTGDRMVKRLPPAPLPLPANYTSWAKPTLVIMAGFAAAVAGAGILVEQGARALE